MLPRLVGLVVSVFLLLGCTSPQSLPAVSETDMQMRQQALARTDQLIVPGQRVGPIRLGMGWDEVLSTLGKADFSYINSGDPMKIPTQLRYFSLNLRIFFSSTATPTVTCLTVQANTERSKTYGELMWSDFDPIATVFHTSRGIGLGSTSFDVAREYGSYQSSGNVGMFFNNQGISFTVTKDHRVWVISVTEPRD